MKPTARSQNQLLVYRTLKSMRIVRLRPSAKLNFVFKPARRFGSKPQLELTP